MGPGGHAGGVRGYAAPSIMRLAGALVALGATIMFTKGVLLIVTGNDRSLVPWFGLFTSVGLTITAGCLWRSVSRLRSLAAIAGAFGVVGIAASIVAVGYLVTGTIPETADAGDAVGGSYVVLSVGAFGCLLLTGAVIAVDHWLPGRWRWLPLAVIGAQFPIFIVAGAIGDTIGSADTTDGLGLALTGAAWMVLGYALSLRSQPPSPII